MQQAVEDGGGKNFVASQDLGPDLYTLVGGDDDGTFLVTVGDQPEEQRGFLAGHGFEADYIEDQQASVDVLFATQLCREYCLNLHWFTNLEDTRLTIDAWCEHHNHVRPHRSLGKKPPAVFA